MGKISITDIQNELSQQHWKLISTTYTNLDTELIYECPEGHKVYAPWKKMRNKLVCPICKTNLLVDQKNEILPKTNGTYRILTLDQASHSTGYAIFDNNILVHYGVFQTNLSIEIERLSLIKSWLISMIVNWKPDFIGLEGIQFQEEGHGQKMGVTVFQTLARLQGILMETCFSAKIPFEICPTNTWRHACGVKGKTRNDRKRSMQLLVKKWYDITVSDDESDAIGIGHYLTTLVTKNSQTENWEQ